MELLFFAMSVPQGRSLRHIQCLDTSGFDVTLTECRLMEHGSDSRGNTYAKVVFSKIICSDGYVLDDPTREAMIYFPTNYDTAHGLLQWNIMGALAKS